jgi:hypothetical protein
MNDSAGKLCLDKVLVPCSTRLVLVKWPRQGLLCLALQSVLVAAQKDQKCDDDEHSQYDRDDAYWSCQPMHVITQEVAAQSIEGRPHDSP